MTARSNRLDQVKALAEDAFRNHELTVIGVARFGDDATEIPCTWRCRRPGTSMYGFYVNIVPGCIAQWGDVGGLMITQGPSYGLAWLKDAIKSRDYVLEKSNHRQTEFIQEMFQEYVREHHPEFEFDYDGGELDMQRYWEETGDSEIGACSRDWPGDALWGYWALYKFISLLIPST